MITITLPYKQLAVEDAQILKDLRIGQSQAVRWAYSMYHKEEYPFLMIAHAFEEKRKRDAETLKTLKGKGSKAQRKVLTSMMAADKKEFSALKKAFKENKEDTELHKNETQNRIYNHLMNGKCAGRNTFHMLCAANYALGMVKSEVELGITSRCFGGKKAMRDYNKKKITKAELRDARLFPFYVIGEKVKQGNRNLIFDVIENGRIFIKPYAGTKIPVYFPKLHKNYMHKLCCLEIAAKHNGLPITLKVTEKDIQLTYDEAKLYAIPEVMEYLERSKNPTKTKKEAPITNFIKTRYAGIDMNPAFIGFSIWEDGIKEPIFKMQYDLSELNVASGKPSYDPLSKHIVDKRHHETIAIAKDIVKYLIHYGVPLLTLENLKFDTGDQGNGKEFNRLCKNVWNRNLFIENITKRCRNSGIALRKVHPAYTTFIGNVMYPTLPDPIAASAEIARRGYKNTKEDHEFYPPILNSTLDRYQSVKNQLDGHHEGDLEWATWKDLYDACVHAGMRYRVATPPGRLDFFSCKSKVTSVII